MFIAKVQGKCEIYRMRHYTTGDSTIVTIFYFVQYIFLAANLTVNVLDNEI